MKKTRKTTQIGDQIRTELAIILQRELRDPAIGFVTVTEVEVASDLSIARIHVSVLGTSEERERTVGALRKASNRIRYLLAQRLKLRATPQLDFRNDTTAESADRIDRMIRELSTTEEESVNDE